MNQRSCAGIKQNGECCRQALFMISAWTQLRSVEMVLDEIATHFDGVDPLKPLPREVLNEAKAELLSLQEQLGCFQIEVDLREPLDEELQETRDWVTAVTK